MLSILVVENHEFFRKSFADLVKCYLPDVTVEDTGDDAEAVLKMDAQVPDVVFLDIRLPGRNGLELAREIKSKYPHVKIGIFSYCDLPEYRAKAFHNGADYFLNKESLSSVEILGLLRSLLPSRAAAS